MATAPVPPSSGRVKRRLLELFRNERPANAPSSAAVIPAASPMRRRLAQVWPIGLVAAALLVGMIAWINLGGKPPDNNAAAQLPPDPLLKKVVAAKVKIDTADSAAERLRYWAELADELRGEASDLARVSSPEEMESLAGLYEQVVSDDALVGQARLLTDDERKAALGKVKDRLVKAEEDAKRLLAEGVSPGSERPLKRIADAAAASNTKLAKLQQGRA